MQAQKRIRKRTKEKSKQSFIISAMFSGVLLLVINAVWPEAIPFTSTDLWTPKGSWMTWLTVSWPIFAWGSGVNLLWGMFSGKEQKQDASEVFVPGLIHSVLAGVVEEIAFRWLIFLPAIATGTFISMLLCSVPEWIFMKILAPVADFATFGKMHEYLFHSAGFGVGMAMLGANAAFRDGHKYQGLLGVVNSWFLGIYFFWVLFNYGLPAAILVHILYDAVIFTTASLVLAFKKTVS